ncbi:MAG TPA: hypothetical protein VEN81_05530, partial [Planctomycetota bacterium]|nr:hypothetical protein [Planctomycetota bacterium]
MREIGLEVATPSTPGSGVPEVLIHPLGGPSSAKARDLREAFQLSTEDVVRQHGGSFDYNSKRYGVTIENGGVQFASAGSAPGSSRATLKYTLEEVRSGSTVIAQGGESTPELREEDRTLSYGRAGVQEKYSLGKEALEQSFVIRELPAEGGDLVVTGKLETNVTPPAEGSLGSRLSFMDQGAEVLHISDAAAVDAGGRRLPLSLAYAQGRISMTVPREWLAQAAFPVVIDPLIGSALTLRSGTSGFSFEYTVDVAYNTSDNLWLAVWGEFTGANSTYTFFGQLVWSTGALLGSPFQISAPSTNGATPSVCYAPAPVNKFLVCWASTTASDLYNVADTIYGRIYSGTGAALTAPFQIDGRSGGDYSPRAAFDGTNWYVAWRNLASPNSPTNTTLGRFVSTSGTPGAAVDPDTSVAFTTAPTVAFANGVYAIVWTKSSPNTTPGTAYARTMTPSGTQGPIVTISPNAKNVNVSGGNGQFLFIWVRQPESPAESYGLVTDLSLNTVTPAFIINSTYYYCRAKYASNEAQWYAVDDGSGEVIGRLVSPGGVLSSALTLTSSNRTVYEPSLAFNPASNEVLAVTMIGNGTTTPSLVAQRVSLGASFAPPSSLSATGVAGAVNLTWAPGTGATSFNVKRSTSATGTFTNLATGLLGTTYSDTTAVIGTPYYYEVTSVGAPGESAPSNVASGTALSPIAPPTNLTAQAGNHVVNLSWTASGQATSYNVKRGTVNNGPYPTVFTGITTTTYSDTTAANNTTYFYVVTAVNSTGESVPSNQAQATPVPPPPPPAPTNLATTPGNQSVLLTWTASTGAVSYTVKRSSTQTGTFSNIATGVTSTSYTNTGLTNTIQYWYEVSATDSLGQEGP